MLTDLWLFVIHIYLGTSPQRLKGISLDRWKKNIKPDIHLPGKESFPPRNTDFPQWLQHLLCHWTHLLHNCQDCGTSNTQGQKYHSFDMYLLSRSKVTNPKDIRNQEPQVWSIQKYCNYKCFWILTGFFLILKRPMERSSYSNVSKGKAWLYVWSNS